VGDTLELMTPQGNRRFKLDELYDKKGARVHVAPGSGHRVTLPLDFDTDMEYALLMRDLPNAPERA
jgi:putative protease